MAFGNNIQFRAITFAAAGVVKARAGGTITTGVFIDGTGAQGVWLWQGLVPNAAFDPEDLAAEITYLAEDDTTWTAGERTHAEGFIEAFGIALGRNDEYALQPTIGPVYAYADAGVSITISRYG